MSTASTMSSLSTNHETPDAAAPAGTGRGAQRRRALARALRRVAPLFGVALLGAVFGVLHYALRDYSFREARDYLESLPLRRLLSAVGAVALGYLALTLYDALSLRYVDKPLSYTRIAFASFVSYAFSMNMGNAVIGGGSVRYRLYSAWGLSPGEIARVVAFCIVASWAGLALMGGALFLVAPPVETPVSLLSRVPLRPLGAIMLALPVAFFAATILRRRPVVIWGRPLALPSPALTAATYAVAVVDWALAGTALYALLPPSAHLSFVHLLGAFVLAQLAGIISQVPGGLVVFEGVVLALLEGDLPRSETLGALVAFRGLYYLLPLTMAALMLGGHEALERRKLIGRYATEAARWSAAAVPRVLTAMIFLAGAMLLFSGATPSTHGRLRWLGTFLPLPVIELSHFLASLTGIGLLVLARGLQRRVDAAYFVTALLLVAGIALSLLKGAVYEEALILAVVLAALAPCRSHFNRRASLIHQRFTPSWWMVVLVALFCSFWLTLFSFKHIDYSSEMWWRFYLDEDAPRSMRAAVGVTALTLLMAAAQLFRPVSPKPNAPTGAELKAAKAIVARSKSAAAWIALLGDKSFLFSGNGEAFLMYAVEGRSWVAMGDPVGPEQEWEELVWRFRERCDDYGGRPVFYQVGEGNLPCYIDMGLSLYKLGEEGRVPLDGFSLEGGSRKNLRQNKRRFEREGFVLGVLPAEQVPDVLPELREISDAWLAGKHVREKGFSLGRFDEGYLRHFPMAVVRRGDRIVAFANVLAGAEKEELSLDLMRFRPDAPPGVMDYLFVELMLWGARGGYRWFAIGMAPLAGIQARHLAPLWNRLGAAIFRYGEHFYNFRGLRQYKEKFAPVWEARYIAAPGRLALPAVLLNVAALIGGGLQGVVRK